MSKVAALSDIKYLCVICNYEKTDGKPGMVCLKCGGDIRGFGAPGVINTRDSFGIGRNFMHTNEDGTKKEITNYKDWEKAGYRDAMSCIKDHGVREKVKEKQAKLKKEGVKSVL